ncbi:MAG: succinate dehydrogenase cytochrome b subunit, partial [Sphingobacteriales bacterium]
MSEFKQTFNSSLGKKLIMALTGLFLCTFLIVHLSGNLSLFKHDNGQAFNAYANFMTHFPPIRVVSYLLYLSIIVHSVYALILTINNRKARPVSYAVQTKSPVSYSSKNMGLLGSILLLFIVIHMKDFWFKYHQDEWFKNRDGAKMPFKEYRTDLRTGKLISAKQLPQGEYEYTKYVDANKQQEITIAKDLQAQVIFSFASPIYVIFYVIAMAALSFHLLHGFQSSW